MKSITYRRYGAPDVLRPEDSPPPEAGPGEVLVCVRAAALNPVDCEMRKGRAWFLTGWRFPKIPGSDFAGEIAAVGAGVTQWTPGEAVYGMSPAVRGGAYAEFIAVKAHHLAWRPEGLDDIQAAALPLASLTALQALRDLANIRKGQAVFIHGGSGGVGTVAVQIAKSFGARVTATCSYRNLELVRELGADTVIDYTKTDVTKVSGPFDIFFDVYGNMPFRRVKHLLTPRGVHVSAIPAPGNFLAGWWTGLRPGGRRTHVVVVRSRTADLDILRELVDSGRLRPVVDRVYPLAEARQASAYLETRRARGKVVLTI